MTEKDAWTLLYTAQTKNILFGQPQRNDLIKLIHVPLCCECADKGQADTERGAVIEAEHKI